MMFSQMGYHRHPRITQFSISLQHSSSEITNICLYKVRWKRSQINLVKYGQFLLFTVVTFYEVTVYIEFTNTEPSVGDVCNGQLKFLPLYMSVNDHESSMSIDFVIRNTFQQEGKFVNINEENPFYSAIFILNP